MTGQTQECPYCSGTGAVLLNGCIEAVGKRSCGRPARNDPAYFAMFPDREWMRPYCSMHGNMYARQMLAEQRAAAKAEKALDA